MMPRNLDRRVEVLFPVQDEKVKNMIITHILETHLNDDVKARILLPVNGMDKGPETVGRRDELPGLVLKEQGYMAWGKAERGKDPGFCLLGARTLLRSIEDLDKEIEGVRKGQDIEAVHRMRVSSRRLRAALPLFEPCFKISQYDRWRDSTKGITAALGDVRDVDVQISFLETFLQSTDLLTRPGVEAVLSLKKEARTEMQSEVRGWLDNLLEEGTLEDMRSKVEKIAERTDPGTDIVRTREAYSAALAHVSARIRDLINWRAVSPYLRTIRGTTRCA